MKLEGLDDLINALEGEIDVFGQQWYAMVNSSRTLNFAMIFLSILVDVVILFKHRFEATCSSQPN